MLQNQNQKTLHLNKCCLDLNEEEIEQVIQKISQIGVPGLSTKSFILDLEQQPHNQKRIYLLFNKSGKYLSTIQNQIRKFLPHLSQTNLSQKVMPCEKQRVLKKNNEPLFNNINQERTTDLVRAIELSYSKLKHRKTKKSWPLPRNCNEEEEGFSFDDHHHINDEDFANSIVEDGGAERGGKLRSGKGSVAKMHQVNIAAAGSNREGFPATLEDTLEDDDDDDILEDRYLKKKQKLEEEFAKQYNELETTLKEKMENLKSEYKVKEEELERNLKKQQEQNELTINTWLKERAEDITNYYQYKHTELETTVQNKKEEIDNLMQKLKMQQELALKNQSKEKDDKLAQIFSQAQAELQFLFELVPQLKTLIQRQSLCIIDISRLKSNIRYNLLEKLKDHHS